MGFIGRTVVNSLVLVSMSVLFPTKVYLSGLGMSIIISMILSLLEGTLVPILKFLTFPISLITLGLFGLIIDAGILELVADMSNYLSFSSFWMAILTAIIIRVVNATMIQN